MSIQKFIYCRDCGEKTAHKFINREMLDEETDAFFRGLLATAILSGEAWTGARCWQCTKCGDIKIAIQRKYGIKG